MLESLQKANGYRERAATPIAITKGERQRRKVTLHISATTPMTLNIPLVGTEIEFFSATEWYPSTRESSTILFA